MKTKQTILEEFDEKVNELRRLVDIKDGEDSITVSFGHKTCRGIELFSVIDWKNIRNLFSKALDEQKEEVIKEMIKLSDKIEAERETPDIQEWKAFKHFRNTMRDRLKKIKGL